MQIYLPRRTDRFRRCQEFHLINSREKPARSTVPGVLTLAPFHKRQGRDTGEPQFQVPLRRRKGIHPVLALPGEPHLRHVIPRSYLVTASPKQASKRFSAQNFSKTIKRPINQREREYRNELLLQQAQQPARNWKQRLKQAEHSHVQAQLAGHAEAQRLACAEGQAKP